MSRYGWGRHRQPWIEVECPECGLMAKARRVRPDTPLHVRAHLDHDGNVCPKVASHVGEQTLVRAEYAGQLRLFG